MPDIKTKIYEDLDLTVQTVKGPITVQDACDELDRYYADRYTMLILWDLTGLDLSSLRKDQIMTLVYKVKQYAHLRKGGKTAFVLSRDIDYGVTEMYQAYAAGENLEFEIEVFRDKKEALQWLGVHINPDDILGDSTIQQTTKTRGTL